MSTTDSIVLWILVFVSGVLILLLKNLLTQNNKKPLTKIFIWINVILVNLYDTSNYFLK